MVFAIIGLSVLLMAKPSSTDGIIHDSHRVRPEAVWQLPSHHPSGPWVYVNRPIRRFRFYLNSKPKSEYVVSVNHPKHRIHSGWTHSIDCGHFWVDYDATPKQRVRNSRGRGHHPNHVRAHDPRNPFGIGRMRLAQTYLCIHGNNNPKSVGVDYTMSCFMLGNEDYKELLYLYWQYRHTPREMLAVYVSPKN